MVNLEYFYDIDIGLKFSPRKKAITSDKTLIKGGFNSGKTYLLLSVLKEYRKDEVLYLDFDDLRLKFDPLKLEEFIKEKKHIKALGLDNFSGDSEFISRLNLESIVITTSNKSLEIKGFNAINLYPLDFEEFISFEKKSDDLGVLMSRFLSIGNGVKNSFLNPNDRVKFIQSSLSSKLSFNEILVLIETLKFGQNPFSANKIYSTLKENFKISKDSVYQAISKFEDENLLFFLPKFEASSRRVYSYDFTLSDCLTLRKEFNKKLINALLCELLYLKDEKFYTDKLDIFVPSRNLAFLVIPFTPPELINLRFKALQNELKNYDISKLLVITMGSLARFESEICECEVVPFWEFAFGFDYE